MVNIQRILSNKLILQLKIINNSNKAIQMKIVIVIIKEDNIDYRVDLKEGHFTKTS